MDGAAPRWQVGWRSGDLLYDETVGAPTAIEAAEAVRQRRCSGDAAVRAAGCNVLAVFALPLPGQGQIDIRYSDMPPQYRSVRAHSAPADAPHGYAIVMTCPSTGERSLVPGRPLSLTDAEWRRDWLLRDYFQQLMRYRAGHFYCPAPIAPSIVSLTDVVRLHASTRLPSTEEPTDLSG